MEQSFSFKRSLLLFKLIFINYVNETSLQIVGLVCIFIAVYFNLIASSSHDSAIGTIHNSVSMVCWIIALLGLFCFAEEYDKHSGKLNVCISYLLPASVSEKFFIPLLTSFILTGALFSIVFVMGGILQLLGDVIFSSNGIVEYLRFDYRIVSLFVGLLFAHSLCCLSAVLFKRGALRVSGIAILPLTIGRTILMEIQGLGYMSYLSSLPTSFWYCSGVILSLLFCFAAYTIFRKRQLNK